LFPPSKAAELLSLAEDADLPAYARGRAIAALGLLDDAEVKEQAFDVLVRLAFTADQDEVSWRSIEALARHSTWSKVESRFTRRLELVNDAGRWLATDAAKLNGWQAFIIAILYQQAPERFAGVVCSLLRDGSSDSVYQAVGFLLWAISDKAYLKDPIIDAFVDCVRLRQTATSAEPYLVEALSLISPDRLSREPWEREWAKWLPDTRVALAYAMRRVTPGNEKSLERTVQILWKLMGDGTYAVRRAAYRTLAEVNPAALVLRHT
jgi:hypothetical protein